MNLRCISFIIISIYYYYFVRYFLALTYLKLLSIVCPSFLARIEIQLPPRLIYYFLVSFKWISPWYSFQLFVTVIVLRLRSCHTGIVLPPSWQQKVRHVNEYPAGGTVNEFNWVQRVFNLRQVRDAQVLKCFIVIWGRKRDMWKAWQATTLQLEYTGPTSICNKLCCILWGGVRNSIACTCSWWWFFRHRRRQGTAPFRLINERRHVQVCVCCVCVYVYVCATADHCLHATRRRHFSRHFQFSHSSIGISGSRGNSVFDIRLWRQMRATLVTHRPVGR